MVEAGGGPSSFSTVTLLKRLTGKLFTAEVAKLTKEYGKDQVNQFLATFDFVVDAVGKASFFRCRRLLKPDGVFAATDLGPSGQNLILAMWSLMTRSGRVVLPAPRGVHVFVGFLKSRMEAGQFRAVIDRRYALAAIADAYRYVETGQKVGIVVIDVTTAE